MTSTVDVPSLYLNSFNSAVKSKRNLIATSLKKLKLDQQHTSGNEVVISKLLKEIKERLLKNADTTSSEKSASGDSEDFKLCHTLVILSILWFWCILWRFFQCFTLSPPNKCSCAKLLACFNFQSDSMSLKNGENVVWVSNILSLGDPDYGNTVVLGGLRVNSTYLYRHILFKLPWFSYITMYILVLRRDIVCQSWIFSLSFFLTNIKSNMFLNKLRENK